MATMGQLYRLAPEYNTCTKVCSDRETLLPVEVADRALSGITGYCGDALYMVGMLL